MKRLNEIAFDIITDFMVFEMDWNEFVKLREKINPYLERDWMPHLLNKAKEIEALAELDLDDWYKSYINYDRLGLAMGLNPQAHDKQDKHWQDSNLEEKINIYTKCVS
jgi:hypothetical protein